MKKYKLITIFIYIAILLLPLVAFNFEEGAISESENRVLADNPFKDGINGETITSFKHYFDDRIGFRDEMIDAYTNINDKLFDKLVHPFYTKGKDGHIFAGGMSVEIEYNEYHDAFINMIVEIQQYCERHGIEFLFVFNPAKPAVYQEYILDSVNYDRSWVDTFFEKLDDTDVNYIDLTSVLIEKKNEGYDVFNKKFDANHWNSTGAYFGINAVLEELSKTNNVKPNTMDQYEETHTVADKLLLSSYRIDEEIIKYEPKNLNLIDLTDLYKDDLRIHYNYNEFGEYINQDIKDEFKLLSFQGSYVNTYGKPHLKVGIQDYVHVHNYYNVLHLPYYAQIFKPDAIIFEVAEYTIYDSYFKYKDMLEINYNDLLENVIINTDKIDYKNVEDLDLTITKGKSITEVIINGQDYDNAWIKLPNTTYDFEKIDGLNVSGVCNEDFVDNDFEIYILKDNNLIAYK